MPADAVLRGSQLASQPFVVEFRPPGMPLTHPVVHAVPGGQHGERIANYGVARKPLCQHRQERAEERRLLDDEKEVFLQLLVDDELALLGSLPSGLCAQPAPRPLLLVGVVGYPAADVLGDGDVFRADHPPHPAKETLQPFEHGTLVLRVGEPAGRDGLVKRDRVGQRVQQATRQRGPRPRQPGQHDVRLSHPASPPLACGRAYFIVRVHEMPQAYGALGRSVFSGDELHLG